MPSNNMAVIVVHGVYVSFTHNHHRHGVHTEIILFYQRS